MTNNLSNPVHILAPLSFLNPTTRYHPITPSRSIPEDKGESGPDQPQDTTQQHPSPHPPQDHGIYHIWRSRDNRKGRHAALVPRPTPGADEKAAASVPRATNSVAETLKGLVKMVTRYPVWDVSYDVAVVFTLGKLGCFLASLFPLLCLLLPLSGTWLDTEGPLTLTGSIIWVVNAFFVWLPLAAPSTEFPGEVDIGGGWTAFIGATIFEFGSVLLMIEAVNENREDIPFQLICTSSN